MFTFPTGGAIPGFCASTFTPTTISIINIATKHIIFLIFIAFAPYLVGLFPAGTITFTLSLHSHLLNLLPSLSLSRYLNCLFSPKRDMLFPRG
jgi:hypothetical protein